MVHRERAFCLPGRPPSPWKWKNPLGCSAQTTLLSPSDTPSTCAVHRSQLSQQARSCAFSWFFCVTPESCPSVHCLSQGLLLCTQSSLGTPRFDADPRPTLVLVRWGSMHSTSFYMLHSNDCILHGGVAWVSRGLALSGNSVNVC